MKAPQKPYISPIYPPIFPRSTLFRYSTIPIDLHNMVSFTLLGLGLLAPIVAAHGTVSGIIADGV